MSQAQNPVESSSLASGSGSSDSSAIRMPTYYEYALMSRHAYLKYTTQDSAEYSCPKVEELLDPAVWGAMPFFKDMTENGYFGTIFLSNQCQQVVVAHAGTLPERIRTLIADKHIFDETTYPLMMTALMQSQSKEMSGFLREKVEEGYHVSFTGHSLGGFLAEMSVYACHRRFHWYYSNASAVTFDSPGSLEVMEAWDVHNKRDRVNKDNLNIISFKSSPNLVNTLHTPPGTVYRLIRDIPDRVFESYLLKSHDLVEMIKLFDPQTGLPFPGKSEEMQDWPLADYGYVAELADRPISGLVDGAVKATVSIISNLAKRMGQIITRSGRRTPLFTFRGEEVEKFWEIIKEEAPDDYHARFNLETADGLRRALDTHYIICQDSLHLPRQLRQYHFIPGVYEFLRFYASKHLDETYRKFLDAYHIIIRQQVAIDERSKDVIVGDGESVFDLRDTIYTLLGNIKNTRLILNHEAAYRDYCTEELQKQMALLEKRVVRYQQSMAGAVEANDEEEIHKLRGEIEGVNKNLEDLREKLRVFQERPPIELPMDETVVFEAGMEITHPVTYRKIGVDRKTTMPEGASSHDQQLAARAMEAMNALPAPAAYPMHAQRTTVFQKGVSLGASVTVEDISSRMEAEITTRPGGDIGSPKTGTNSDGSSSETAASRGGPVSGKK